MFSEILYAFICFLFLLFLHSKIIDKPTSWPFLGMLPALALNLHRVHDWSVYALAKVGGTSVLKGPWFTNMANIVFTTDPENVRYIFNTNFSNYPKGSQFKEIFDILGDGIFNADLDSWKTQRKTAHQIVRKKQFLEFVEQSCRSKVETGLLPVVEHVLQQNMVVDLQEVFKRLTFDMTVTIISGIDPCCLGVAFEEFPYVEAMDNAEEAIFYRHVVPVSVWKLQRFLGIGTEKKLVKAKESLDRFIAKCISAKREKMKEEKNTGVVGADLLTSYMSDPAVSDKFLRDTMLNFMEAGRGGVGAALTWFFWLVSQNPDVEQKIIEELRSKAKDGNPRSFKVFDMEELNGLVYLHGAFCECLRLFPPVPFEHKLPVCPDILPSGHKVDSRTKIVPLIYAMGRMKAVWGKDCLEFKPERWITEEGGIKYVPSYKFMAFSSGPRICIGKETAFIQLKMVAATLLYNYSVQVLETSHSMSPTLSVILYMNKGMNVQIKRRF